MRLLDLFCGAGGCSVGYHRAGFTDIVGVDLHPQPRYPFRFIQADALEFLSGVKLGDFDMIHASPPCQAYSRLPKCGREYPDLVAPTRNALLRIGTPYAIENVVGAPLIDPVLVCGAMFGLRVYRHRLFETSYPILQIPHIPHKVKCPKAGTRNLDESGFISVCGHISQMRFARRAMGIDWMSRDELSQAIPPAYTQWVGEQMIPLLPTKLR